MAKTALVISGGGSKGAYAVGVVKYMSTVVNLNFDIVIGTSTGALIAPFVITNKITQIEDLYRNAEDYKLVKKIPASDWRRANFIYETDGLRRKLEEVLTPQFYSELAGSAKNMLICTVDLVKAKVVLFYTGPNLILSSENYEIRKINNRDMLINAIHASADMPVFMPLVNIGSGWHGDGGVRDIVPVWPAFDLNAEKVYAIVLSSKQSQENPEEWKKKDKGALIDTALRTVGMIIDEVRLNDVRPAKTYCDAVTFISGISEIMNKLPQLRQELEAIHSISPSELDAIWKKYFEFPDVPARFVGRPASKLKIIQPEKNSDIPLDTLEFKNTEMRQMIATGFAQAATQLLGD